MKSTLPNVITSPSPKDASPCFLIPTQKELLVGGRKVVGSAQRRGRRAFLQHGSIPISLDYDALAEVTGAPVSAVPQFRSSFAGLAEFASGIDRAAVRAALERGFRETFPGTWER